jgi:hypothetical protein
MLLVKGANEKNVISPCYAEKETSCVFKCNALVLMEQSLTLNRLGSMLGLSQS